MPLDMRRKVERMLAGQLFRELRVALLEGVDHIEMLDDRALCAVVLPDRHLPDGADMDEQVFRHIADQLIAAEPDDRLMESDVGVGVVIEVAFGRMAVLLELVEQVAQAGNLGIGGLQRDQARGKALECRPYLDHLDDLLLGLAHHEDAAPGQRLDEALLLQ